MTGELVRPVVKLFPLKYDKNSEVPQEWSVLETVTLKQSIYDVTLKLTSI